jgi:hypothetical protein
MVGPSRAYQRSTRLGKAQRPTTLPSCIAAGHVPIWGMGQRNGHCSHWHAAPDESRLTRLQKCQLVATAMALSHLEPLYNRQPISLSRRLVATRLQHSAKRSLIRVKDQWPSVVSSNLLP